MAITVLVSLCFIETRLFQEQNTVMTIVVNKNQTKHLH